MKRESLPMYAVVAAMVAAIIVVAVRTPRPPKPRPPVETQPAAATQAGGAALRGLVIELYADHDDRYERELTNLAAMKTQVLLLSVRGCQEDINSSRVFIDHPNSPDAETVLHIIRRARELKMQVLLLPIVLPWDTNTSEDWRGVFSPRSWDRWWDSYERFIVHYAQLAEKGGAEMFSVGSELISTEKRRSDWLRVIRKVRAVYKGKLLYSANWDHYREVSFWDALDLIGMTSYHTLAKTNDPTIDELRNSWRPIKREILDWQRTQRRPLVFTEVGYASQDGCAREPWNYYGSTKVDLDEQYLCLQAFIETWSSEPAVAAICVHKWEEQGGPSDLNYTPKGKPAEELLRRWMAGGPWSARPSTAPATRPATRPNEPLEYPTGLPFDTILDFERGGGPEEPLRASAASERPGYD